MSLPGYDEWKTTTWPEWECPACENLFVCTDNPFQDDPLGQYPGGVCEDCAEARRETR